LVLNELDGTQSQSGCFGEEGSWLSQELTHSSSHIQSTA
jgi:hypothetical protein